MSSLGQDVRTAVRAFAAVPRVLVAVDFDGTLASLVTDPAQARALPGGLEALREAAALPGVATAIVSGRDLETLTTLTGVEPKDGITLVGSHGAQTTLAAVAAPGPSAGAGPDEALLLEKLGGELERIRSQCPGVRVEHKPAAVVLHTRGVERSTAEVATAAALEVALRQAGVHIIPGKEVVELSVSPADKGTALNALARASRSAATLYLGDDTTDERAFAALDPSTGDLPIKVGDGKSIALQRVSGPSAVVEVLQLFVETRRA